MRFAAILLSGFFMFMSFTAAAADGLKMNDSWSDNKDPIKAIGEVVAMLQKKGTTKPKLIVTYFTQNYEPQPIIDGFMKAFPGTKIYGQTVYMGVFTSDGLHVSRNGSIAALSYEGDEFVAGISGDEIEQATNVTDLSAELSKRAVAQAGKKLTDPVSLAMVGAKKGNEEAALAGMSKVFAKDTQMMGGTPSTNSFGGGIVITNDKFYRHGMAVAVLYAKKQPGSAFYSGFETVKKSGKVTEVNGRILSKIDGKPAQAVYKEWAGGRFDGLKAVGADIATMETAHAPLAKKLTLPDGQQRLIFIRPQKFMADGTLTMGADLAVGDELFYVDADKETFIKRAGVAAEKAEKSGSLQGGDVAGGLQIYCAGASTVIGIQEGGSGGAMVKEIATAMKGKPFIGGFTSAEQGDVKGFGFVNGNLMSVMAVFPK